jgi:hypothetical protein
MDRSLLLSKLPAFGNNSILIERSQTVHDIIKEVLESHAIFASDYDKIASDFNYGSTFDICKNLWYFCKKYIRYRIEPEARQTTKSPAAILALGDSIGGDCKHYAGFIAGVLDALNRQGRQIDWFYRFASYDMFNKEPQHVFVVVNDKGREIWIDPVLNSFNEKYQYYHVPIDKKVSMLNRISGLSDIAPVEISELDYADSQLDPELLSAIKILLKYQVIDQQGRPSQTVINRLSKNLSPYEFDAVTLALDKVKTAAIGGLFDSIWTGIKTVTLALPRLAYQQLVLLNFNGLATKLHSVIFDAQNKIRPESIDLKNKWESLGGSWQSLLTYVEGGYIAKAYLGVAQAAAWAATAAVIIAAMTPIVTQLINKLTTSGAIKPPTGTLPPPTTQKAGFGVADDIITFIKGNPAIVAAGLAGAYLLYENSQKKKRGPTK